MTTKITIEAVSHYVLVSTHDSYTDPNGLHSSSYKDEVIVPGQSLIVYSTTTRSISIEDLEHDDRRTGALK
jgi:hypothetical protein